MKIKTLSERLKMLRMEKQMTQKELAQATGLSQSAIAYWENGQRIPNVLAVIALAKFFHAIDYLIGFKDK
ncbi:MAG: helix-turn-helix transcriptional regulator [Clostridia bacterium]|nr:helix-turn-helix transcriptional regulator [Clostridia bacterium]